MPQRKGTQKDQAKLTEEKVLSIRREYRWHKVTQKQLAKKYGVAPCTIGFVLNGSSWKHVDLSVPGHPKKHG